MLFFCPSAEDKKEYIIELISSELDRRSESNEMVEALLKVRQLLVSWKELTISLQVEPTWVTSCLWKFWKECVRNQHYWFSCDELLMFAHLSKMNVIVCKQCAATVYDVFGWTYFEDCSSPVKIIGLQDDRGDNLAVRSHFEPLINSNMIPHSSVNSSQQNNDFLNFPIPLDSNMISQSSVTSSQQNIDFLNFPIPLVPPSYRRKKLKRQPKLYH